MAISAVYAALYYAGGRASLWPVWAIYICVDMQLVLVSQYSIWPDADIFGGACTAVPALHAYVRRHRGWGNLDAYPRLLEYPPPPFLQPRLRTRRMVS